MLFDSWSVEDFKISFTNPAVKAGDVISGNVSFTVKSEMAFRSVTLKVMGKERTHVTVTKSSGNNKQAHVYREHRNIFKVHLTLLGAVKKQQGGDWSGKLAPGQYNFPFAVRIPIDALPSCQGNSFSANEGAIQWNAKSRIVVPFRSPDCKGEAMMSIRDFTVITSMPLGQLLSGQQEGPYFSDRVHKSRVCCCCCTRGSTQGLFSIERTIIAFGHDQQLRGFVTVNNEDSDARIDEIRVILCRTFHFSAHNTSRAEMVIVASERIPTSIPPRAAGGDQTFPFSLALPTNDPKNVSSFRGALTRLDYHVTVGCDNDTLGTVTLLAGGAVDPTNQALPVGVDVVQGQTVPKGQYPKFLYAPPPAGAQATIPPQSAPIGPFSLTNNVPNFPYI